MQLFYRVYPEVNLGHVQLTLVLFDNVECWDGTWQLWSCNCFVSRNVEMKDDRRSSSGLNATVRLRRRFSRNLAWVRRAIMDRRTNANRLSANPWRSWCCSRLFLKTYLYSLATQSSIFFIRVLYHWIPFKSSYVRRTANQGNDNHFISITLYSLETRASVFLNAPSNNLNLFIWVDTFSIFYS